MTVRAKFRCTEIKRITMKVRDDNGTWIDGEARSIQLTPVYGNGDPEHENTKFYAATPSGSINLHVVNLAAAQEFDLNGDYYVDFTRA